MIDDILFPGRQLHEAVDGITDDFVRTDGDPARHRRKERIMEVLEADYQLEECGESVDRVTVANEILRRGELESCDGISYLVSLDDGLPDIFHLDAYVRILKEKAFHRKIVLFAQALSDRALLKDDPRSIMTAVEDFLLSVRSEDDCHAGPKTGTDLWARVLETALHCAEQFQKTRKPAIGLETGIRGLDEILSGFNPGLHLLSGGPGVGKTSLSLQISLGICQRGTPIVYISFENSPANLIQEIVCARAAVEPRSMERGILHSEQLVRFRRAGEELTPALARFIAMEGHMRLGIGEIRACIRETLNSRGARTCLVVFDCLQRAAPAQGYKEVRTNVSMLAAQLRDLAMRLECPVLAISSQNRAQGNYGGGRGSSNLDSLKESGDLEYSADSVISFIRAKAVRLYILRSLSILRSRRTASGQWERFR
ncbi:MAG: DnaB-like helicase C-terminal domain-containing protein [Bryobacteraceae bacterium]